MSSDLDFPVGQMNGNSKLSIISAADVNDAWDSIKKRESISLWCDRVRMRSKRKADNSESNSDSDDSSDGDTTAHKSKKRNERRKNKSYQQWRRGMNVLKTTYLLCVKNMVTSSP